MTAPTIATLIANLEAAEEALGSASSARQRRSRERAFLNAGIALHARLEELQAWLSERWEGPQERVWLENLAKYEKGYQVLTQAQKSLATPIRRFADESRHRTYRRPRAVYKPKEAASGKQGHTGAEGVSRPVVPVAHERQKQLGLL